MAKFKVPYQNLELDVPDEGQIFRDNDSWGSNVFQRVGNKIVQYSLSELAPSQYQNAGGTAAARADALKTKYGVDYNSLPVLNMGDAMTAFGALTPGQLSNLKTLPVQSGEVITKSISPVNPQGSDLTSSLLGSLSKSPSLAENAYKPDAADLAFNQGATPRAVLTGTPGTSGAQRTLIDIANSRPDVLNTAKAQGGDPFTAGTKANTWLNDWWNTAGKNEYPGTTLTQPLNAPQIGTGGATGATGGGAGVSYDPNDPRAVLANTLKEQGVMMQKYFDTLKSQPTAMDLFKQYSDQLGISSKSAQQTGLMSQVNKTEQLLNDLEKNISTRITELGEGMSEAQRARQYATERRPIMDEYTKLVSEYNKGEISFSSAKNQLVDLMKYTQSDQEKQASLAAMPLEYSEKTLPNLLEMSQYQSPAQKLADQIALKKATEGTPTENQVQDLMKQYPDAGILPTDDIATASAKLKNSKIYQDKVRGPVGPQPTASEKRDAEVSTYLQNNKGTDGFVSASTYQNALTKFITGGGSQTNFTAAYPQQTYLRQQEIDKLPASLRPQTTITKSDLTPDQTSIINDAKAAIDQAKQRYQDWGALRQQIIDQSKKQYNFDISPYI